MNKMTQLIAIAVLMLSSFTTVGQESLTIEESILGAYGVYSPEQVNDLKWIKSSENYSYRQGNGKDEVVMKGFVDGRPSVPIVELPVLSKAFENSGFVSPESIPPFEWIDERHMLFTYKGQFWDYDYVWKAVGKRISCTHKSINHEIAPSWDAAATTIGNNVYISTSKEDSVQISFYDDPNIVAGTAVSRYEFGINKGLFWAPNSTKLAYYVKDETKVTNYDLINYGPIPAEPMPIKYPMAGQLSEHVQVMVFELATGNTVELETEHPTDHYLTSVTFTEDSKSVLVGHLDREQNNFSLVKYDAQSGKKIAELFSESNEKYVEPKQEPYLLKGSKGQFLWFSERDGFNQIYHYDAKGKLLKQVTTGDKVMSKVLHYDREGGFIYVRGTDLPTETVVYKVSLKTGSQERITAEPGTHKAVFSTNGKYFIDWNSSLSTPMDIKVKDNAGKEHHQILSAADPFENKKVGTTEIYTIKADDGTDLYGRMIKPSDFDEKKKYPVLVYVYNGPHVQLVRDTWMGGASLWMHYLAERGYIVYSLDGRGSKNRGIVFEQAVHRNLGSMETKDQLAGVEHLKSLPYVDSDRMAIHGWSFGGYMTLNLMLREPGTFKAGVAGGAVTDWRFYEIMYTERYMDSPQDNPEGYENTRLAPLAAELEGDLMLVHGTNDDVVVPQHLMVMLNAFINAGEQVDLFLYPGHGHNVRGNDRVHLMTKVLNYIEDKLQ